MNDFDQTELGKKIIESLREFEPPSPVMREAIDALRVHCAAAEAREKNAHDAAAYWRTRAKDAEEEVGRTGFWLLVAGTILGGVGATLLWIAGFWIAMR